ncbi:hypothetical protein HDU88_001001 [Geranomyces variabilis]|nr:hypothetical protein HDU88_001001 [Geranomyces variabilis]
MKISLALSLSILAGSALAHPKKCHHGGAVTLSASPVEIPTGTGEEPSYPSGPQPTEVSGDVTTVLPPRTETVISAATSLVVLPGTVSTISTGHGSTVISQAPATSTVVSTHSTVIVIPGTTVIASPTSAPSASSSVVAPASHTTSSAHTFPTGTPGPDGQCGQKGWICPQGECCSRSGYCGTTADYCGTGCQPLFGFCLPVTQKPLPPVPTGLSGRDTNVPAKIIENCAKKGDAAFTFDDGPFKYTMELLALLKKYNVKSTFFLTGHNYECTLEEGADAVRAILADGHQIASHTWSHPMPFNNQSPGQTLYQVRKNEDMFIRLIGESPKYFRPPQGQINDSQVKQIAALGYKIINWSIDTGDADGKTWQQSEQIIHTEIDINKQKQPIQLSHEVKEDTVRKVMPWFLAKYAKAYNWVTVAECLGDFSHPYMTVPLLAGSSGTCADADLDGSLVPGQ